MVKLDPEVSGRDSGVRDNRVRPSFPLQFPDREDFVGFSACHGVQLGQEALQSEIFVLTQYEINARKSSPLLGRPALVGRNARELWQCRKGVRTQQLDGQSSQKVLTIRLGVFGGYKAIVGERGHCAAECDQSPTPLRGLDGPFDQVGENVRAHVLECVSLGFPHRLVGRDSEEIGVSQHPLAEREALVGGLRRLGEAAGDDGEEGARGERGQEQGELLPVSPHGGECGMGRETLKAEMLKC